MNTFARRFPVENRALKGAWILLAGVAMAYLFAQWVLSGQSSALIYGGLIFAGIGIVIATLNNWKTGLYLFVLWLLFEDFARKFVGNSMVVYFGKDILVGVCYLSFLFSLRQKREQVLRTPVLFSFAIFFWLGLMQVFNPNTPSLFFGLLGLKLYFYYMPLIFLGFALVDSEKSLQRLLILNALVAALIGGLGIVQAVVGPGFLNPAVLAPELETLSNLTRYAPISGVSVFRPTSVFVSDGRFASFMLLSWIVTLGSAGYFVMIRHPRQRLILLCAAVIGLAIVMSGSRGSLMYGLASLAFLAVAFVWGAPHARQSPLLATIQKGSIGALLVLVLVLAFFPGEVAARLTFYSETLGVDSPSSELVWRGWGYPFRNLMQAFDTPEWQTGYGMGVSSLGVQYVIRYLRVMPLGISVESGYGTLIIEMGVLGLVCWLLWSTHLLSSGAGIMKRLRSRPFFPVGVAILWFAFVLLFPLTFMGMASYQNFVLNAFFWMLVGVLYRLPGLSVDGAPTPTVRNG